MEKSDLLSNMNVKKFDIIDAVEIGDRYRIAIYKGKKKESLFDFIVKYRELFDDKWSRIRTPKHTHWIVDILIKRSHNREETENFVEKLHELWESIRPLNSQDELNNVLNKLSEIDIPAIKLTQGLHHIEFLYKTIYLLMIQEKTNYPKGTITSGILKNLEKKEDWFGLL